MKKIHALGLAGGVILGGLLAWLYVFDKIHVEESITNFEECAKIYPVMESYPAQCRTPDGKHFVQTISKYSGQETRLIKSLSVEDVEGLEKGTGDPFGGMAKLAELNGYPGPRHVLDLALQLALTSEQKKSVEKMNDTRVEEAQTLGKAIVELEQEMNEMFIKKTITEKTLRQKLAKSGELYGELRFVHLKWHLAMLNVLTEEQVKLYNKLRGYIEGGDPCKNIPEGHDMVQWKKHNGCK